MKKPFNFSQRVLDLSEAHVMGVLNVTPDSFSDGGKFNSLDSALKQTEKMIMQGATIIDVGGESTRPGAQKISNQEELDRVCPIIEKIISEFETIVSVDTSTPHVMAESIRLGVGLINDVRAFNQPGVVEIVKNSSVALCIMHMKGNPLTMQHKPHYDSVVEQVSDFLKQRVQSLVEEGVNPSRLILDPGFGFGKTLQHNLQLLNHISDFCELGYPVLVGLSRKSMFAEILDKPVDQRLFGSLSAAAIAAYQGACIIRAHDVQETRDAVLVVNALKAA